MPSYAYSEETVLEVEGLDDLDIRECQELAELEEWAADCDALTADIHAQLSGYRAAGLDNRPWVYRACQKLGYLGRAQARIKRQMKALGHDPNPQGAVIDKLNRKLQALRAESGVAVEFMRLALERMPPNYYRDLQSDAVHALAERLKKQGEPA